MADRSLSTAPVVPNTEQAAAALIHVLVNEQNKLLSVSLLLSMITKQTLSLDQVDNTADAQKPVSVQQAQAISQLGNNLGSQIAAIAQAISQLGDSLGSQIAATNQALSETQGTVDTVNQTLTDLLQDTIPQIHQTLSDYDSMFEELATPTTVMPIALAKIGSAFATGPAFSLPIAFDDMMIESVVLTLGSAASDGETSFDLMVNGTSILATPVTMYANEFQTLPFELYDHYDNQIVANSRMLQVGDTLSGTFTSVGLDVRTPVLLVKWRKVRQSDYPV